MELHNQLIDLAFSTGSDHIHSGYCIRQSRHIVVLNNFDTRTKRFDGFTVFRVRNISGYRPWTEEQTKSIKKDERQEQIAQIDPDKMNTLYSVLQSLGKENLVAVFTENETSDYWVARITALTKEAVTLKLVDTDGEWMGTKKVKIDQIDSLSFLTKYEKRLQKKIAASSTRKK
jgi:hypothetical protein